MPAPSVFRDAVEQWRPQVTMAVTHFGGDQNDVHRFLRIMQCESGGDPDANIWVSAWLALGPADGHGGGWHHWVCR